MKNIFHAGEIVQCKGVLVVFPRQPRFNQFSTHTWWSQLFIVPVPGNSVPSSGLCGYETHKYCTDIDGGKTSLHIQVIFKIKK